MTTLASIERAVAQLPPAELSSFRRWFAEFDADAWDAQIAADAAAGKLDALAAEALAEFKAGKPKRFWEQFNDEHATDGEIAKANCEGNGGGQVSLGGGDDGEGN